jgi:hypothetical protein
MVRCAGRPVHDELGDEAGLLGVGGDRRPRRRNPFTMLLLLWLVHPYLTSPLRHLLKHNSLRVTRPL